VDRPDRTEGKTVNADVFLAPEFPKQILVEVRGKGILEWEY
jgi:hypothetical protein